MQVFPDFHGISYPVKKMPETETIVQQMVSGKEIRFSKEGYPKFRFILTMEFLTKADYQRILTFYHQMNGCKTEFLFWDKSDYYAADNIIGIGDGTTVYYQLYRNMDGLKYPVKTPLAVDNVKVSGIITTNGTVLENGVIQFYAPPPQGAIITASFSYYYKVRFTEEMSNYEKFAYELWNLRTLEILTVK